MVSPIDYSALTFLVVDDESVIVDLVHGLLQSLGAKKVHKAVSAMTGLNMLMDSNEKIDCIVSDHNMQPLTGLEFLKKIRVGRNPAMNRNVRFVMLTAHGDVEVVKSALALDVDSYVIKPVTRGNLDKAIIRAVTRKRILSAGSACDAIPLP